MVKDVVADIAGGASPDFTHSRIVISCLEEMIGARDRG